MTDTLRIPDESDVDSAEHFVFDDADWAFYELVLKKVGDRRIFVTFDGDRLEVMSPSPEKAGGCSIGLIFISGWALLNSGHLTAGGCASFG